MLAAVRRARYSYLLAMHILLLCAAQRTPTEIAAVLFCSRTTVYRVVAAYRAGQWAGCAAEEETDPACSRRRLTVLSPALKRSVGPFCTACRACVGGVGRGGVAPQLPWNSTRGARLRCQPRRCGGGCMS